MAVCLILTLLPATALAADEDTQPTVRTSVTDEETLRKAIEDASAGDVIQLSSSFAITEPISVEKELTLDLNGKTISVENDIWDMATAAYSLVSVSEGGDLTITGDGTLQAKENDSYAVDVRLGGKCTIQSGTFVGNVHSVYVLEGTLVVNGGTFSVQQIFSEGQPYQFVLNCLDENYENRTAKITVNGGSFVEFDPYNCEAEGKGTNFCAPGYVSVTEDGGKTYTVHPIEDVAVAEVDDKYYMTLVDAVLNVPDGGTITMLRDASGAGIGTFKDDSTYGVKNFTIDFHTYTYTCVGPAVGSTGTQSQAFHLEWTGDADNNVSVTLKNGTITSTAGSGVYMLVQNYCDLTLENMTLDGKNMGAKDYALSNNCGNVLIKDSTILASKGGVAFDVCDFRSYPGVTVTVEGDCSIQGPVEVVNDNGGENNAHLVLKSGTFTTDKVGTDYKGGIADLQDYVAAGNTIQYNDDGTYTVVAKQANAAEVVPAAPEVKKPADLTGDNATAAETVASALATTEVVTGTGLNAAATGVANENTITAETQVEETTVLGKLQTAASDSDITAEAVTIVIQPYMNVEIQDVDTAARTLTVDVTPMYRTVATTDPDNIQLTGGSVNAVEIGTAQKLTITKPVTVKIPVPDSVAGTNTTAYVTHIKDDGTMYVYTGTISGAAGSKVLTFENPNGFSTLKVTTGKPVAAIGKTTYTSLQDAIDKAKPGETVKLLDDVTLSGGDGNTKGVITIANKDIILDGNHFMLKADGVVDKTSMINVQYTPTGKTVTIKNLKIDSNGEAKHGININGASVSVETVEIVDGTGYGIVCNNSALSVNGLTTSGNGWGGINVDASDAQDSSLTVLSATLNEQNSIIFENRNNKNITATIEDGSFQKVGAHATDGTNLDKMNITINGGSFAGLSSTSTSAAGQKATITVNDGTFAVPVSDVADTPDYQVGSSQNGYRYYETLSEAMEDVKDGDTLTNVHASAVYTVTFKYNDGVHDDVEAQLPATFNLPSVPSRSGYTFGGWSDGTRTFAPEAAVTIQGNTVFNGFWSSNDSSSSHRPSSGSSSTGDYAITVDAGKHGDVSVSPKRADEGDTVTITADPDNGYVVDEVIVTDKNGDDIRVRDRGDGEYTFTMPDSKVTVEVTFVEAGDELSFVDVAKSDYYYDAVKWAVENGVTTGVTDTIFAPGNPCTRAQTVTFLWRAAGMPQAANRVNPFTDVSVNDYYYEAVLWAVENGITGGTTATTFSPNATCTRAQVVTFLWRYSKEDASILPVFTDVAEGDYYYGAVAWAVENGVTTGVTDTSFVPGNPCTRGQIVTFLYRYMGK